MGTVMYKKGKILFGLKEENYLYTKNGFPIGKIKDEMIFSNNGQYIGEINKFGELIYKSSNNKEVIDEFTLPSQKKPLSKKQRMIGIMTLLGRLTRPTPGLGNDEIEFPDFEEMEKTL